MKKSCSLVTNNGRLEVLRALVGHIPPNPPWAELSWSIFWRSLIHYFVPTLNINWDAYQADGALTAWVITPQSQTPQCLNLGLGPGRTTGMSGPMSPLMPVPPTTALFAGGPLRAFTLGKAGGQSVSLNDIRYSFNALRRVLSSS
jgi:hypothetical protein